MDNDPLVLVVDDHSDTVEMLSLYLTSNGCRVITAASGVEALQVAAAHQPMVVLLDLAMPTVTGHDVARRLRETALSPGLRLVATTGRATAADRQLAIESGFDDFFSKPYEMDAILDLVRQR